MIIYMKVGVQKYDQFSAFNSSGAHSYLRFAR